MCNTCGCSSSTDKITYHVTDHHHHHKDYEDSAHKTIFSKEKIIEIEEKILSKNNFIANENRKYFSQKNITAINIMSSPGAGKTTLLEMTISALKNDFNFYIIEGDQQGSLDAKRIERSGAPVIQVNTGNGCHLDAEMIYNAVNNLDIKDNSFLLIENVGNLVCPALFDLGENKKIIISSIPEGEDKPIKYPNMFSVADMCIINKIDLAPYIEFDIHLFKKHAQQINHKISFVELSAKKGTSIESWYRWLRELKIYETIQSIS